MFKLWLKNRYKIHYGPSNVTSETSGGLNPSKDMAENLLPRLFMPYTYSKCNRFIKYLISNSDFVVF